MDYATRWDGPVRDAIPSPGGHASYRATTSVIRGPAVLEAPGGAELDDLLEAAGAPLTARRTWLRAWVRAYEPAGPEAVVVRDEATGRLDGVAVLWARAGADHDVVAPLGRRQSDRGALPARHAAAAEALAAAVTAHLRARRRPWLLRLGQLPAGDPVAAAMVRRLGGGARLVPGVAIPKVEFGGATSVADWLGGGLRKQLRKARNRLDVDGVEAATAFTCDAGEVAVLIDEIEHTHRARERDADRTSDLDAPPGLRFWRAAILDHAARGELEVATLRLDGHLAAYVVSLLDRDVLRVFDGRCSTASARYSPGRLLETAVLERALAEPRFARVDWMNGLASEKLLTANAVEHTEHLVAASSGLVVDVDVMGHAPAAAAPGAGVLTLASGAR
ncbi:MAG TPA: GNAT family N-acetyltransferase [Acidimicrobiales bacterium]|jgi:CelD/BcsL family acetyltransferase involved in cellulose biosynthesis|nr:GNAT family N-acetyltransferase [Acidimicrobiales bacterium]